MQFYSDGNYSLWTAGSLDFVKRTDEAQVKLRSVCESGPGTRKTKVYKRKNLLQFLSRIFEESYENSFRNPQKDVDFAVAAGCRLSTLLLISNAQ